MTELHNDHAQIANNEGAYIPMEDVDAALRRIGDEAQRLWSERSILTKGIVPLMDMLREERERLGLPKEVKA